MFVPAVPNIEISNKSSYGNSLEQFEQYMDGGAIHQNVSDITYSNTNSYQTQKKG